MNHRQEQFSFEEIASQAEQLAQSNQLLYKLKLLFYALPGYGIIFLIFSMLGLIGGMVALVFVSHSRFTFFLFEKKLIVVLFPTIWVLFTSLWIRFKMPTGYLLTPKECPVLFEELDQLRRLLKSQKIHRVILTEGSRASIVQTPRLGILGWNKNSLVLGLELLLILSPEQAKAVLVHELGHLSAHCNRLNVWVSRQRLIGYNIMQAYKQKGNFTARFISCFFGWYAPRFAAYSFVLARAHEYEADALSAQLTSAHLISHALVNICVMNSYLKCHYWQEFLKQADESPVPKQLPWKGLRDFLNTHWPTGEQFKEYLDKELQQKTHHYDDVHPALGDRIHALGVSMPLLHVPQTSAALVWCGEDKLQQIISDFDAHWVQVYQAHWQKRYQYVTKSKEILSHLKEKADSELTHEELLKKITLIREFESESEALSLLKDYQSRCPDNPEVAFRLGLILYKQNDEGCLVQFKIALSQYQLAIYACMCAYFFLVSKNRTKEMRWWEEETHIQMQVIEKQKN